MNNTIRYIRRALLGVANTSENAAYQRSQGLAFVNGFGNGGFNVLRQIAATQPAGIVPGPSLKLNNPAVTGNINKSLDLQPLTDNRSI